MFQEREVILWCDGGLRGKNPGGMLYGSYQFGNYEPRLLEYGMRGTSNEAEYMALIEGLNAVIQEYGNVQDTCIVIKTDSQLMRNQLHSCWRVHAENLVKLHYVAQMLLENFLEWRVRWVSRGHVVEVLGH